MMQKLTHKPGENKNSSTILDSYQEDEEAALPTWSLDILLEIFYFLPPKTLFRFKSLSRSIRDSIEEVNFISKYSNKPRRTSFTGLFYQTKASFLWFSPRVAFLPRNPHMELPSLDFLKQRSEGQRSEVHAVEIMDSCNGIILYRTTTNGYKGVKTVYVCNPLTREKVIIPHPRRRSYRVHYALLSGLSDLGLYKFKVVGLYDKRRNDNYMTELLIYSSETREWEAHEERVPKLSYHPEKGSKVFFNDSLYWNCFVEFMDYILVCHLNVPSKSRSCYELIEAPKARLGRSSFILEQNLICYCHKSDDAWCLQNSDTMTIEKTPSWDKFGNLQYINNLKEDLSRLCKKQKLDLTRKYAGCYYQIIAFDHNASTIFLWFKGSIFSYHVKKRWFKVMVGLHHSLDGTDASTYIGYGDPVVTYTHCLGKIEAGKRLEEGNGRKIRKKEKKKKGRSLLLLRKMILLIGLHRWRSMPTL